MAGDSNRSSTADLFTLDNFNAVLKGIKDNNATGTDHVQKRDYSQAPDDAKLALCDIMRDAATQVAWPLQTMIVPLHLRGKP